MAASGRRAVWVSTSTSTHGGIATYVRNMQGSALWRDWHIRHVVTHCNGSVPTRIARFGIAVGQFLYVLAFQRPDVVHIHTSSHGSFARKCLLAWIAKAFRVPIVMHVHGSRFDTFFANSPAPVQFLIRTTLEHSDAVIALGNDWADKIRRIAPRAAIHVEVNTIQPQFPVEQLTAGPVRVVFLGEVGERKGTFVLLAAWARLLTEHAPVNATLTIAGDGDLDRARNLVAELGLEDSVEIRGWISATDVSDLLGRSQVLVLPSLHEGQPMAILEGMSHGMCIVATRVGGIPEMLGESGGILASPGDVDSLVYALDRAVNDDGSRVEFGGAALELVKEQFNIESTSHRLDRMYRLIVAGGESAATTTEN